MLQSNSLDLDIELQTIPDKAWLNDPELDRSRRPYRPSPTTFDSQPPSGSSTPARSFSRSQSSARQPIDLNTSSFSQPLDTLSISALPPVDGGKDAWLFLAGATMIEILVWGLPFSVGILHTYWTNELFPGQGAGLITIAATLQTGMMYMSAAFFSPLLTAYPHLQIPLQILGLVAGSTSLIGSAFVKRPWELVLTLGVVYPLSGALYLPAATLLFEWFQTKRGLASGIMYAGTGAGGTVFPFVMSGLLGRFGYKVAMVSLGIAFAVLGSLSLTQIKRRIPIPRNNPNPPLNQSTSSARTSLAGLTSFTSDAEDNEIRPDSIVRRKIDYSFLRRSTTYAFTAAVLLTSLGNFIPSVWIPSFADSVNSGSLSGTSLVAIMNAASIPGILLLGHLTDLLPIRIVILISCLGASLSCLFLWGFATSGGMLVAFVIVFGACGLGFTSVWTRMISVICKDDPALPALVFSLFTFVRGIGNITSGPVADALLKIGALKGGVGGYGVDNFGVLLIYTGTTILLGAGAGVAFSNADQ